MWYRRGYQDQDASMISSVTLEVNGLGTFGDDYSMILDNADFIIPPQENNAIFIMTNFIRTDQEQTRCVEGIDVKDAYCSIDSDCQQKRKFPYKTNGRWTGRCRQNEGRCEMEGWCPVEYDLDVPKHVVGVFNYTLTVKNFIEFNRFGIYRENFLNDSDYFVQCRYDASTDPHCPIFRLGDLINLVENDTTEREKMLTSGAVIRIKIDWLCNLDLGQNECKPEYSFGRLDSRSWEEQFSYGFNFRYASHWNMANRSYRTLTKAFGLRFIVTVNGEAGRFDFLVLTLNIGSMIGVLGLATFICDIVALYFCKQGSIYRKQKFQTINVAPASSISTVHKNFNTQEEQTQLTLKRPKQMNSHLAIGDEC